MSQTLREMKREFERDSELSYGEHVEADKYLELPTASSPDIRQFNVGTSDYAKHKIQPWDIWLDYDLNPWDADLVKRVLRTKEGDSRILDYEKMIHICQERIRQLKGTKND